MLSYRIFCLQLFQGFVENKTLLKSLHCLFDCVPHGHFSEMGIPTEPKFSEKVETMNPHAWNGIVLHFIQDLRFPNMKKGGVSFFQQL